MTDPARRLTASQALEHPWAAAALPDPADLTLAQANMRRAQGSGFRVRAALARSADSLSSAFRSWQPWLFVKCQRNMYIERVCS